VRTISDMVATHELADEQRRGGAERTVILRSSFLFLLPFYFQLYSLAKAVLLFSFCVATVATVLPSIYFTAFRRLLLIHSVSLSTLMDCAHIDEGEMLKSQYSLDSNRIIY
jgi:hypothetical protein